MFSSFFSKTPLRNQHFVAFYSDGSGAAVFCNKGGSIFDAEGEKMCKASEVCDYFIERGFDRWLPLPDKFEFFFMGKAKS